MTIIVHSLTAKVLHHEAKAKALHHAAKAYLLKCTDRDGKPLSELQACNALRLAEDVVRMTGLPLMECVKRGLALRGYRLPQLPEHYVAGLQEAAVKFRRRLDEVTALANQFSQMTKTVASDDSSITGLCKRHLTHDEILEAVNTALAAANTAEIKPLVVASAMNSICDRLQRDASDISPDELAKEIEEIGSDLGISPAIMQHHVTVVRELFHPPSNRHMATLLRHYLTTSAQRWADVRCEEDAPPVAPLSWAQASGLAAFDQHFGSRHRATELTNHGHPIAVDAGPFPDEPGARPDLTEDELANFLAPLAAGDPQLLEEIREFARTVRQCVPDCSNRYILEYATHVYTDPEAPSAAGSTLTAAAGTSPAPAHPGTVKVEIELPEEDAAALWADGTWCGAHPKPLEKIVRGLIQEKVAAYRKAFGLAEIAADLANFRQAAPF